MILNHHTRAFVVPRLVPSAPAVMPRTLLFRGRRMVSIVSGSLAAPLLTAQQIRH